MLVFNRSTPPRGTLSPSPENRLELASFCIVSISLRLDQVQVKLCVAVDVTMLLSNSVSNLFIPPCPFQAAISAFPLHCQTTTSRVFPSAIAQPCGSSTQNHAPRRSSLTSCHMVIDLAKNGSESDRQTESFNTFKHHFWCPVPGLMKVKCCEMLTGRSIPD